MTYKEMNELLSSLGWEERCIWNNRTLYALSYSNKYQVFEHQCEIGIINPYNENFHLIYCNLTVDELKEYTQLTMSLATCEENPKTTTLSEYQEALSKHKEFISKRI